MFQSPIDKVVLTLLVLEIWNSVCTLENNCENTNCFGEWFNRWN